MSEGLKRIDENLSRSWRVDRTDEPFYDGKKGTHSPVGVFLSQGLPVVKLKGWFVLFYMKTRSRGNSVTHIEQVLISIKNSGRRRELSRQGRPMNTDHYIRRLVPD